MIKTQQFVGSNDSADNWLGALRGLGSVASCGTVRRSLLDTFDRRLAARDLFLICDQTTTCVLLVLRTRQGGELARAHNGVEQPTQAIALHDLRLRRHLSGIIRQRALIAHTQWRLHQEQVDVADDDGKLLGNIMLEHHFIGERIHLTACTVPKRGYGKELRARLRACPGDSQRTRSTLELAVVLAREVAPTHKLMPVAASCDVSAAPNLYAALAALLATYLTQIRSNEAGIRDDIDREFLHDFRIALRRIRTLLTTFRATLPAADRLRRELAWLSAASGPQRDFDVWLAEPQRAGTAAATVRPQVIRARAGAHRRLLRALATARYTRWQTLLESLIATLEEDAQQPTAVALRAAVNEAIWRSYRKLARQIQRHTTKISVDDLHELRKRAKKLRYILEACAALYPVATLIPLLSDLKRLQSSSGAICDDAVRSATLREWLSRDPPAELLGALGVALRQCLARDPVKLDKQAYRALRLAMRALVRTQSALRYRRLFRPESA